MNQTLYSFEDALPQLAPGVFVAPGARLIGQVAVGAGSSIWFNVVIRADYERVDIGEATNIQDLSTLHVDSAYERPDGKAYPVRIGNRVTVGHHCVIHGCTIEDDCLIGMGAVLMNGVVVGRGSIVGAGALVLENTVIPPFSLVVGHPATVKKTYPEAVVEQIRHSAEVYRQRAERFRQGLE